MTKARITAFRGSREGKDNRFAILDVEELGVEQLVGARVVWKSASGRVLEGKVRGPHGQHAVLARFHRGLPGQALGTMAEIKPAKSAKT